MGKQNKKTPIVFRIALALLCVMLLTSYMISGVYSRFSTTAVVSNTATIAKIDIQTLGSSKVYTEFDGLEFVGNSQDVYAVIEEFTVTNIGDVSYNYVLNLRLSSTANYNSAVADRYITLAAPESLSSVKYISGVHTVNSVSASTLVGKSTFDAGAAYYAVSTDNKATYTWNKISVSNDNYKTITFPTRTLAYNGEHHFKVVYFIKMSTSAQLKEMTLSYSARCEQID